MGFLQGEYKVKNKDKYVGNKDPRYLSSWELEAFKYLDGNPNIMRWGSELVIIKYFSPVDGRDRRYMVDLFVEYYNSSGKLVKEIIEIKPFKETKPPKNTSRKKRQTYLKELYTWEVNKAKWAAAAIFAKQRKLTFRIITEKSIFK